MVRSQKLAAAGSPIHLDLHDRPAEVLSTRSRFNHQRSDDRTAMGWINPLKSSAWRVLLEREVSSFVAPFTNIGNYTTSRTVWYDRFVEPSTLRSWLLAMKEHTFYVYLLASLVTKIMSRKDILPPDDREIVFARFTVYSSNLKEEHRHFATFRLSGLALSLALCLRDQLASQSPELGLEHNLVQVLMLFGICQKLPKNLLILRARLAAALNEVERLAIA